MMTLLPIVVNAAVVEINGVYYDLVSKTQQAEVTSNPNKYTGSVVIPEKVYYDGVDYSVTSIGEKAFYDCSGLTSAYIGNSVTTIGYAAFYHCYGLTSLTIGNNVTSISIAAFAGCSNLPSVTIPNSVTSIGNSAFSNCRSLTFVTIPNSVTTIGENAFWQCINLTSVYISNSVTTIGKAAFFECSKLAAVYIRDLEAWCKISFYNEDSNPLYYAHHLFLNDLEIKDLVIPNKVTTIGNNAFRNCFGLTSVTIPNSVTSIGGSAFQNCSGLTSVTIGNSVTTIYASAFYKFTGLTSVTIPNSVTKFGGLTFYGCSSLRSVTIGNGVKTIISEDFACCKDLQEVYCYAENVPSTNSDAFQDSYTEYATLHVPAASVNAYREADPWKNFKEVVSLSGDTPEPPVTPKCDTPSISYGGKKLTFGCKTEGVEYVYTIKDVDVKTGYDSEVSLSATYEISVYATKTGYENSDVATATLVWNTATFTETTAPTAVRELAHDAPLLIQSHGGVLTIQGADDGQQVRVYGIDGTQAGATISQDGHAMVKTNLKAGNVAIIKIGDRSVKVVVK